MNKLAETVQAQLLAAIDNDDLVLPTLPEVALSIREAAEDSEISVLDLSKVLAGPLCGQYLGELGARVIKVEPVGTGDDTRAWLPQDAGQSATFLAVNHNKRSLAVDLKSEAGRAVVHRLAAQADVVLQGFGGKTASRLGVDYETLAGINPRLVYCEISGYGREGPMGEEPGRLA